MNVINTAHILLSTCQIEAGRTKPLIQHLSGVRLTCAMAIRHLSSQWIARARCGCLKRWLRWALKRLKLAFLLRPRQISIFLRELIDGGHVPDDVTIQVLTQAREHLIDRTIESSAWRKQGYSASYIILPLLCNAAWCSMQMKAGSRPSPLTGQKWWLTK